MNYLNDSTFQTLFDTLLSWKLFVINEIFFVTIINMAIQKYCVKNIVCCFCCCYCVTVRMLSFDEYISTTTTKKIEKYIHLHFIDNNHQTFSQKKPFTKRFMTKIDWSFLSFFCLCCRFLVFTSFFEISKCFCYWNKNISSICRIIYINGLTNIFTHISKANDRPISRCRPQWQFFFLQKSRFQLIPRT